MSMGIKALIAIVLLHVTLFASHVPWLTNFDKAHQKALKEHKNLLVLLIKPKCSLCKKMIQESFINQAYIDNINTKFVSVLVYKDQLDSYPIEMLYTTKYPSLFILDNKEIFIQKPLYGYARPIDVNHYLFK